MVDEHVRDPKTIMRYWRRLPKPWFFDDDRRLRLDMTRLEIYQDSAETFLKTLPGNIYFLSLDIQIIEEGREPYDDDRINNLENVQKSMERINLPWRALDPHYKKQVRIVDGHESVIMMARMTDAQNILRGIQDTQILRRSIEDYFATGRCKCGHERLSHLFLHGSSACVERPCMCQQFGPT
jgi:hypothetical protein